MLATAMPGLSRTLARWGVIEPGQAPASTPADYIPIAYGVYRQSPSADWEQSFALTEALLRELQREVTSAGARLAMVSTTAPEQVYPKRWQAELQQNPAMQRYAWDSDQPNRVLREIANKVGIPTLDLLPIFRENATTSRLPLHLSHDGHWTEAGERLAGDSLVEFLAGEGLLAK
jgi:hypothetical protein